MYCKTKQAFVSISLTVGSFVFFIIYIEACKVIFELKHHLYLPKNVNVVFHLDDGRISIEFNVSMLIQYEFVFRVTFEAIWIHCQLWLKIQSLFIIDYVQQF